jgi:hypothetical protein
MKNKEYSQHIHKVPPHLNVIFTQNSYSDRGTIVKSSVKTVVCVVFGGRDKYDGNTSSLNGTLVPSQAEHR